MIIKITGYTNKSYTKKDTGELVEGVEIYYTKKNKNLNGVGEETGTEYISGKAFPEQFKEIVDAKEKIVGRLASISKDTRTWQGKTYTTLDEFELIK